MLVQQVWELILREFKDGVWRLSVHNLFVNGKVIGGHPGGKPSFKGASASVA
jgi:hypothetical protein